MMITSALVCCQELDPAVTSCQFCVAWFPVYGSHPFNQPINSNSLLRNRQTAVKTVQN